MVATTLLVWHRNLKDFERHECTAEMRALDDGTKEKYRRENVELYDALCTHGHRVDEDRVRASVFYFDKDKKRHHLNVALVSGGPSAGFHFDAAVWSTIAGAWGARKTQKKDSRFLIVPICDYRHVLVFNEKQIHDHVLYVAVEDEDGMANAVALCPGKDDRLFQKTACMLLGWTADTFRKHQDTMWKRVRVPKKRPRPSQTVETEAADAETIERDMATMFQMREDVEPALLDALALNVRAREDESIFFMVQRGVLESAWDAATKLEALRALNLARTRPADDAIDRDAVHAVNAFGCLELLRAAGCFTIGSEKKC